MNPGDNAWQYSRVIYGWPGKLGTECVTHNIQQLDFVIIAFKMFNIDVCLAAFLVIEIKNEYIMNQ